MESCFAGCMPVQTAASGGGSIIVSTKYYGGALIVTYLSIGPREIASYDTKGFPYLTGFNSGSIDEVCLITNMAYLTIMKNHIAPTAENLTVEKQAGAKVGPARRSKDLLNALPDKVQAKLKKLLMEASNMVKGTGVKILELSPPALYGVADGRAAFRLILRPGKVETSASPQSAAEVRDLSSGVLVPASGLRKGSGLSDINMNFPVLYLANETAVEDLEFLRKALALQLGPEVKASVYRAISSQLGRAYASQNWTTAKKLEVVKEAALKGDVPFELLEIGKRTFGSTS